MGNLYTQLRKRHDYKLDILFKLKHEYNCSPCNWKLINKLKKELDRYEAKTADKRRKEKGKKRKDLFGNIYYV